MLFVVTVSSSSLNSRVSCLPFLDDRSSSLSLWQPYEGCIRSSTWEDILLNVLLHYYYYFVCVCSWLCASFSSSYVIDNQWVKILNTWYRDQEPYDVQCYSLHFCFYFCWIRLNLNIPKTTITCRIKEACDDISVHPQTILKGIESINVHVTITSRYIYLILSGESSRSFFLNLLSVSSIVLPILSLISPSFSLKGKAPLLLSQSSSHLLRSNSLARRK